MWNSDVRIKFFVNQDVEFPPVSKWNMQFVSNMNYCSTWESDWTHYPHQWEHFRRNWIGWNSVINSVINIAFVGLLHWAECCIPKHIILGQLPCKHVRLNWREKICILTDKWQEFILFRLTESSVNIFLKWPVYSMLSELFHYLNWDNHPRGQMLRGEWW